VVFNGDILRLGYVVGDFRYLLSARVFIKLFICVLLAPLDKRLRVTVAVVRIGDPVQLRPVIAFLVPRAVISALVVGRAPGGVCCSGWIDLNFGYRFFLSARGEKHIQADDSNHPKQRFVLHKVFESNSSVTTKNNKTQDTIVIEKP
jgi:hypothetical protein